MRFSKTAAPLAAPALALLFSCWGASGTAAAQQDAPPPPPREAEPEAKPAARVPEGERIVNLPSADVPRAGTLTILFTHRFSEPLEEGNFHNLFTFDSGADIGIGLAYAPIENFDVALYRSSNLDDYELDVKYRALQVGSLTASVRVGGDWRSERHLDNRNGVFAQAILAYTIAGRVRLTAVPTYVSKTSGQPFVSPKPFYKNVFNVPAAISIGITRTFNVHGEIYPRVGRADSTGVGWIASIEKTVPRHRFAFTVGNMRTTNVDQYVAWKPQFFGQSPHPYFIGFNLVRQWKL